MEITGREVRTLECMMIKHLSAELLLEMLTVKPCVAIDLAQLTMNLDLRCTRCIQKLYHRPHFTVGWCWNKSLHLQPLQRCYFENSGSPASVSVIRRHYFIIYIVSSRNKWFNSSGTSGKLTLSMLMELNERYEDYGMKINISKAKVMVIGRKPKKIHTN